MQNGAARAAPSNDNTGLRRSLRGEQAFDLEQDELVVIRLVRLAAGRERQVVVLSDHDVLAVDHVDVYFNAGHPGVEVPHAHVVLWHVPAAGEAAVAK